MSDTWRMLSRPHLGCYFYFLLFYFITNVHKEGAWLLIHAMA